MRPSIHHVFLLAILFLFGQRSTERDLPSTDFQTCEEMIKSVNNTSPSHHFSSHPHHLAAPRPHSLPHHHYYCHPHPLPLHQATISPESKWPARTTNSSYPCPRGKSLWGLNQSSPGLRSHHQQHLSLLLLLLLHQHHYHRPLRLRRLALLLHHQDNTHWQVRTCQV